MYVRLSALILAGALGLGVTTLAPAADAAPVALSVPSTSGIVLLESTETVDPTFGDTVVTGLLRNGSARTVDSVRVVIDQLDARGEVLFTVTAAALAARLDAGETSAFKVYLAPIEDATGWRFRSVEGDAAVSPANHNFTILDYGTYVDEDGFEHVEGVVANDNTAAASMVTVGAAFLDAAGKVVDAELSLVQTARPFRMAADEVGYFDIVRFGGPAFSTVVLVADAGNDPSPLPVALNVSGGGVVENGRRGHIRGRLVKRGTDTGVEGIRVELLTREAGSPGWSTFPGYFTDGTGAVSFDVEPYRNSTYKLRTPGSEPPVVLREVLSAESADVSVTAPLGVFASAPAKSFRNQKLGVHVSVPQASDGRRFVVQELVDGAWVKLRSGKLDRRRVTRDVYTVDALVKVRPRSKHNARLRVVVEGSALNGRGVSKTFTVKLSKR